MKKPILSIAVPSFNAEAYLDKCLYSMANPEFIGNLEVIIINDGSTDGTLEIAKKYIELYPDIFILIEQENGGHGSGIMTGIANAAGTYFRILDADDWVATEALCSHMENLKDCDSDLAMSPFTLVDMLSEKESIKPIPKGIKLHTKLRVDDTPELFHYYDIHCLAAKTELLRKLNISLPLKTFYEYSEFVFKTVAGAETVTCFPENVYQYMVGNVSQSMDARKMVERYNQHDLILRRMIEVYIHISDNKKPLGQERVRRLALKQLIIGLIYDDNRKRGRARAKETMEQLSKSCLEVAKSLRKKYVILKGLNRLGVKVGLWEKMKSVYQRMV